MKFRYLSAIALSVAVLASCDKSNLDPDDVKKDDKPDTTVTVDKDQFNSSTDKISIDHEFRAAWLTTVSGLDWPDGVKDPSTQKANLVAMIKNIKAVHCNAVIMQVVSMSDAMYKSSILPWSATLTGTQGQDPGYDPLALAVQTCREQGLEIHAWINPMRIGTKTAARCASHPALMHPERVQEYNGSLYWDPGLPEVQQYLKDIVTELMTNYDLDGVHIDDYFYPSGLQSKPLTWDDSADYAKYGSGMTLDNWRYSNIDKIVKAMYDAAHAAKSTGVFGVSPAGRLGNTKALYADPSHWIAAGTVDYLAPQIYWYIGHSVASFPVVLPTWTDIAGTVPIIPGIAAYRYGETGFKEYSEFLNEIKICRSNTKVCGNFWFRTKHILASGFKSYILENIYPYASLAPKLGNGSGIVPSSPSVTLNGKQITWAKDPKATGYAVYELHRSSSTQTTWTADMVYSGTALAYDGTAGKNYVVLSYNGKEKSPMSNVVYLKR